MSLVYFDSSALVKLLVDERDSERAADIWNGCDAALSSRIANAEVCAALAAAGRSHRMTPQEHREALGIWADLVESIRAVELTADVSRLAGDLAHDHRLTGADAIHLASAVNAGESDLVFASWDNRLRTGAHDAGLRTAPNPGSVAAW